ncbi:hypothetical protein EVJ27_00125 [Exiguobacterium sp. SH3S2]|uniref:hypothetical protein n=1 Tax=unclassified Exiguobacterium TaxID=2644629 RepID=UPI0010407C46|nr:MULTISPECIES: hypothetical protein [unclassified Exiguobacterium]TCI26566.1 hypothetical protein EVJ32_05565 [Exiguobacterium sp. SH5S4]TCI49063.1 hypothetical protein EVJ28_00125 [Exiguobacterium sp. SH3S3]TCI53525.1 hypothetical protein EVJ30_08105 [Exiguobacterium sp. SH5S13]TCI64376.1 hypothetical protein EVJ27_00125 [Exiguobacterium sp. SH3S2]TCI66298.1 hypothetical protein EVJ26_01860 [Exiguobacterium sp. SH3S1]
MKAVSLLTAACLGLLTYLLYFVIDAFPTLDRPTSFFTLTLLSFVAIFVILIDGVRKSKSGGPVMWSYIALACTLLLAAGNLFIWFIGRLAI